MTDTLRGKLLVAMPGIGDPRFERAVIMMCSHDAEHAMGVIVNKPKTDVTLGDVLGHLGLSSAHAIEDRIVMDGGPVRPNRGFVLHSEDFTADGATQDVAPGVRLTATRDVLESMAHGTAPERFVLALGCSSWGAGQLEGELRHNVWMIVDPDDAIVYGGAHDEKWAKALHALGLDPVQLLGPAGNA
ncbi:MAG: YqgE/AlgH family protein [Hyphomonadaceae bacterium]|nr:YqgE/AlgH family protein [Hyphomonadaceae bacterium]